MTTPSGFGGPLEPDAVSRLREYVRRVPGLLPFVRAVRARLHARVPHEQIFTEIYEKQLWALGKSVSGIGSDEHRTRAVREQLPVLWRRFGIRTLVDVPCGDFSWMRSIVGHLDSYIGIDVVAPLIEQNRARYSSDRTRFQVGNIVRDRLPEAHMILCRDCFIHFSAADIAAAVSNLKGGRAEYLLTTTYRLESENKDILTGSWRPINLELAPFNFPEPIYVIDEEDRHWPGHSLALWRLSTLPDFAERGPGLSRRAMLR